MAAAICRQLDALPLAIELAAARARTMTLAEIGRHLASRFRLLRGELRGALNPHPSLLAAVQWSYDLLDPEAQLVFVRLSVFAGGFTADSVVAVCADRELDELGAIDVLDRLIGRSMVVVDRSRARARYSLLETLRQFGADRLAADSRRVTVRTAHAAHYLSVAQEARRLQATAAGAEATSVLDAEWDNFRVAFAWLASSGDAHLHGALGLVNALRTFAAGSYRFELLSWAEQAVVLEGARQDPAWPPAAAALSLFRLRLGDLPGAETSALEARQAELDRGGQPGVAPALAVFAVYWRWRTDLAYAVLPDLEAAAEATGDAIERAVVRYMRVIADVQRGVDGSAALADAAVREAEETSSPHALATAHACVVAAQSVRDLPAAIDALRRVQHWAAIAGDRMIAENAALWVAVAAIDAAPSQALAFARHALHSSAETGTWGNLDLSLANVLLPLVEFGRFHTAARLLGGVIAHPLAMPQRDEIVRRTVAALTEALDARQCAELQAAGGRLSAAELAQLALTEIDDILGRPG
jgi:hypothetical protein